MASYTQSNTDPVSVNGMYLKLYTDIIRDISEDLKEGGNVQSFMLHSMLLRSTVIRKHLQTEIDADILDINKKIDDGLFGDLGKNQAEYIRGFCIVSAAMKFIGDAFHIIQNDSASLVDITDDELIAGLERYAMARKVRQILGNNRDKIKLLEKRIADGNIPDMATLMQELAVPDEVMAQDDPITQGELTGGDDDSKF
jgi:hypothetical protein